MNRFEQVALCLVVLSFPGVSSSETTGDEPSSPAIGAGIRLPECAESIFDGQALIAQLRIELLDARVELGQGETNVLEIVIGAPQCAPEEIIIRVTHLTARYSLESRAELSDRPFEERGRVLALLIAEQVRTILTDVAIPEPEGVETEASDDGSQGGGGDDSLPEIDEERIRQIASDEVTRALAELQSPPPLPRRVTLGVAVGLRGYPVYDGSTFGGEIHLSFRPVRRIPVVLTVDGGFFQGVAQMPRGDVLSRMAGGGLGFAYSDRASRIGGEIGARLWLGRGWVEGWAALDGVGEDSDSGLVIEVMATSAFRFRFVPGSRVWMRIGATVGYVIMGLAPTSGGVVVGGNAGPCFGLDIGIDVALGAR